MYRDAFVLHDETKNDPYEKEEIGKLLSKHSEQSKLKDVIRESSEKELNLPDTRLELQNTWLKWFKYQPIWKIRNYYGEKIALYFAWSGTLITTLWIPCLFGIAVFFYGLHLRYMNCSLY